MIYLICAQSCPQIGPARLYRVVSRLPIASIGWRVKTPAAESAAPAGNQLAGGFSRRGSALGTGSCACACACARARARARVSGANRDPVADNKLPAGAPPVGARSAQRKRLRNANN